MINIGISGLRELKSRLEKAKKTLPDQLNAELGLAAEEIRGNAVKEAPADQGILRAEIQKGTDGKLSWFVFSNAVYSGYVEFGTRSKVRIPAGLEDEAAAIRSKSTSSLNAKEAIFGWCKRNGIDKKLWYPIFIKIMTVGIEPHPFFFKQIPIAEKNLRRNAENLLKRL